MSHESSVAGKPRHRALFGLFVAAVLTLSLSACGLGRTMEPIGILAPEIDAPLGQDLEEVDWGVQVRRPTTDRMRDSERVLVRAAPSRLQAYPGVSWLDNAPDLLQMLTIQALEDSGRFQGVGRVGGLQTRFILATELRRFEGVDDGSPDLSARLVVHAKLVSQRSGRLVASRTFRFDEPASGKEIDPLVTAFERALQRYFEDLLPWLITEGQRDLKEVGESGQQNRDRQGA